VDQAGQAGSSGLVRPACVRAVGPGRRWKKARADLRRARHDRPGNEVGSKKGFGSPKPHQTQKNIFRR
jgi:hypothetical protein